MVFKSHLAVFPLHLSDMTLSSVCPTGIVFLLCSCLSHLEHPPSPCLCLLLSDWDSGWQLFIYPALLCSSSHSFSCSLPHSSSFLNSSTHLTPTDPKNIYTFTTYLTEAGEFHLEISTRCYVFISFILWWHGMGRVCSLFSLENKDRAGFNVYVKLIWV